MTNHLVSTDPTWQTDPTWPAEPSPWPAAFPNHAASAHPGAATRLSVQAKFLHLNGARFFIHGVSYGSFAQRRVSFGSAGDLWTPFPPPHVVAQDFARMRTAGINTVRLYDLPPTWLLDLAAAAGLRVILGFPWAQHICLDREDRRRVVQQVYQAARTHAAHAAVLMCCVGNEIPSSIVRWYGKTKTEQLIAALCDAVHEAAPECLATYANYPTTEYLELPFLDVASYNVYLHDVTAFKKYLMRLHTLAGERPLLLTEIGMDSLRAGQDAQAAFLRTQLRAAFDYGVCGAIVFSWTDEWFRGGRAVDDWAFGLVDRARHPKPAYFAVQETLAQTPFAHTHQWPRITVIVAAYNAAATLDECLASLMRLNYPDYEVLVVNDGSVDGTAAIADRYAAQPRVRVLHTENRGLSAARNLGLAHAQGEIVAYTDADCLADPNWLRYLALALTERPLAGVGGPNYTPPDDGWLAQCVGRAPGNPQHILLDDELAEHIPGCNMAFWRERLEEIGGFHPDFRVAGDDVDICWRLQERGYQIGFAPTAFVWHRRRNSIRAFLKQQVGYGRSEGLLDRHHPHKFNRLGQVRWFGSIYGPSGLLPFRRRVRIYYGEFGAAPFQTLEFSPPAWWVHLPQMPEWYLGIMLGAGAAFFLPWLAIGGGLALALTLAQALYLGWATPLPAGVGRSERLRRRGVAALLNWLQPLARSWGRFQGGLGPWGIRIRHTARRGVAAHAPKSGAATLSWRQLHTVAWTGRVAGLAYWSEAGHELADVLRKLLTNLQRQRLTAQTGDGWHAWDIQIRHPAGVEAYVYSSIEYHGGPQRLLRVRLQAQVARWASLAALVLPLLAVGAWQSGWTRTGAEGSLSGAFTLLLLALPLLWPIWLLAARLRLMGQVLAALESTAEELGLTRMGQTRGEEAAAPQRRRRAATTRGQAQPANVEPSVAPEGHPSLGVMHIDLG